MTKKKTRSVKSDQDFDKVDSLPENVRDPQELRDYLLFNNQFGSYYNKQEKLSKDWSETNFPTLKTSKKENTINQKAFIKQAHYYE